MTTIYRIRKSFFSLLLILSVSTLSLLAHAANDKPTVLILLGPPGSGKGTQAVRLAKELNLIHISTGDLLRTNVKNQTELGKQAKEYMEAGKLVPDALVSKMLFARIAEPDAAKGYILDGYPRTLEQAKDLDTHLNDKSRVVVINLKVSDEELLERIKKRGEESAEKRADDQPEVAKNRLKIYHDKTKPLIAYYQEKGKLIEVEGNNKKPREVFKEIMSLYKKQSQN